MRRPGRIRRAAAAAWREFRGHRRDFAGADIHRLLLDWVAQARSADDELRGDLRRMRARARDLGRNDGNIKRYFRLLQNNVIGPMGIKLQAQVWAGNQLDARSNAAIEEAWRVWSSAPVTLDGKQTLRQFERSILRSMACDGEVFVRIWKTMDGLRLQAIDADLIDETYSRKRQGRQNEIRMGIEVDDVGRPVGYWVWDGPSSNAISRQRYFVPAQEMVHLYDPERLNQTRGVPWIHAIMVPAHMLRAYEESEAVAARVAASKMGFFVKRPDSMGADLSTETLPATTSANPGTFDIVPEGYGVETWSPDHPTSQFSAFIKQLLRRIASGLSVFYNVLANDAEGVSYSTMRSFALVERDDWRSIQQDFIDMWRRPLYAVWIGIAILTGEVKLASSNPQRYMAVRHRPRGWQWIDPEKEAKAAILAIQAGLGTRTGFLAEKGEDIEDIFAELAREESLAAEYGISIAATAPTDSPPQKETEV